VEQWGRNGEENMGMKIRNQRLETRSGEKYRVKNKS